MYINPYEQVSKGKGLWLRANFHTHAGTGKGTCGANPIEDVLAAYSEGGYEVLTISNHDLYSDVHHFESKYNMVLLDGYEYSAEPHMLCIDTTKVESGKHQQAIDSCTGQGGFVILCHPNWQHKEYWSWKDIDALKGYTGIEIMNTVIFRLSGSGLATDTWDYLLSQGKQVWGFANDDFHRWFDMAKCWNMIYAPTKTHGDVKSAILNGSFYTSTGLILNEFTFDGDTLHIAAASLKNYIKNYQYIFIGKHGQILKKQEGECAQYKFSGDELYVRVQVISEHGAMLWTQPIYKAECFYKP